METITNNCPPVFQQSPQIDLITALRSLPELKQGYEVERTMRNEYNILAEEISEVFGAWFFDCLNEIQRGDVLAYWACKRAADYMHRAEVTMECILEEALEKEAKEKEAKEKEAKENAETFDDKSYDGFTLMGIQGLLVAWFENQPEIERLTIINRALALKPFEKEEGKTDGKN